MSLVIWSPAIGITAVWRIAPSREHRDVGGAAADVDQDHAEFLLVAGQHRVGRRHRLQDQVRHFQAAAAHALDDVLHRRHRAGDDVHRTSRRMPLMPIGSRTSSWLSTMNSCGTVCSSCWSVGMLTAFAVSITRATSVA
jgi:hypothetical protein